MDNSNSQYPNFNTDGIPPGMSANTLGLDEANHRQALRKRILKITVIGFLFAVIAAGVFLYFKNGSSLTNRTLTNDGYTYTLRFYRGADEVRIDNKLALKYGDKVIAGAHPTTDQHLSTCSQISSAWHQAFTISLEGKTRPVCTTNGQAYYTNFEAFNQRHLFVLTYKQAARDSTETIKNLMQSLKVAR
jgi:hypothetical protein